MQTNYHKEMAKTHLFLTCILGATGATSLLACAAIIFANHGQEEALQTASMITSGVGGASIAAAIKTSQLYRKEKQIFEKMNSQLKELQK